jgi:hypothetical protein
MDRTALRDLLELPRPLSEILRDVAQLPWDSNVEHAELTTRHLASVLRRHLEGVLDGKAVEDWANAIEMRDDIAYDPDSTAGEILHELANPLLTEPLTSKRAAELLGRCQGSSA